MEDLSLHILDIAENSINANAGTIEIKIVEDLNKDLLLVEISDDGVVKLRLTGACQGCPMSTMTLKMGIERALKSMVPEVKEVVT